MFKNILLICNPNTRDRTLFDRAIKLAKIWKARLTAIDVVRELPRDILTNVEASKVEELQGCVQVERKKQLDRFVGTFHKAGIRIDTQVLCGAPAYQVIQTVVRNGYDLVMLTAEGEGGSRDLLMGATAMQLIRQCPAPVWIIKPLKHRNFRKVLACVDPSANDQAGRLDQLILKIAMLVARTDKCKLHIVHACDFYAESLLKESPLVPNSTVEQMVNTVWKEHEVRLNQLISDCDFTGIQTENHFVKGEAAQVIMTLAEDEAIDLTVMGTIRQTNMRGAYVGSTAEKVFQKLGSSVLALKPEGFNALVK